MIAIGACFADIPAHRSDVIIYVRRYHEIKSLFAFGRSRESAFILFNLVLSQSVEHRVANLSWFVRIFKRACALRSQ
jgi:hypothetical protein